MLEIARQTVVVDGKPVIYERVGNGEPIVLVHGLSGSTRWWRRNIPALAARYQLYLVDLPGFGAMRQVRGFHLERGVDWLEAWINAIGLGSFHLIGHSMGGYISMALAARHPQKVKCLVLVNSLGAPLQSSLAKMTFRLFRAGLRTTPAFWPVVIFDGLRAGVPTLLRAANQIVALDASLVVNALQTPTLLIWGERDDLVPISLAHHLHSQLVRINARLLVIRKANHVCMFEQPEQFNAGVLHFLNGQEESALLS